MVKLLNGWMVPEYNLNLMNYLKITDIEAYTNAFNLSNQVWDIVIDWNYLSQKTIGVQIIRAVDSISANIAEGFGRYHKKDKIKFYYYARASTVETFDWLEKSIKRNLISQNQYIDLKEELDKIPKTINALVKYTNSKLTM
jgi:four helix bundle protein